MKRNCTKPFTVAAFALLLVSCSGGDSLSSEDSYSVQGGLSTGYGYSIHPKRTFEAPASIPHEIIASISAEEATFLEDLNLLLKGDTDSLLLLVDKTHYLPDSYAPHDLVSLTVARAEGCSYMINRENLSLRQAAESALEEMAVAARQDGVTLLVSSTYRSYEYQKIVYRQSVAELGQEEADRGVARPGVSQHQLGTVVDFGSITDEFSQTKAGRWLASNAHLFGWSLSFPQGYEAVTGYRWECWHYRYLGKDALAFQRKWFDDVQQYMLEFIHAWKEFNGTEREQWCLWEISCPLTFATPHSKDGGS